MKIKSIIKKINKDFKPSFWLSILPASLIFGILGQLGILAKYNALPFFSWGQVLNDTAILLVLILSYFIGYISDYLFIKLKPNKKEKIIANIFIPLSIFIILFLFSILDYFIQSIVNIYLIGIIIFYIFGYLQAIFNKTIEPKKVKKKEIKYWIFIIPSLPLILLELIFIVIMLLSNLLFNYIYQNIEIQINGENYNVNYMNDKYIIYGTGEIIPNDGENIFKIKDINELTNKKKTF